MGSENIAPDGVARPPQVLRYTLPDYTDAGFRARIEGVVTVEAAFDAAGGFRVLGVVKGLGFGLDEQALNALAEWQFFPAQRNGAPAPSVAEIDIPFRLPDNEARELWEAAESVGAGVSPPRVLDRILPAYTPEARAEGREGVVVLEAVVLGDGSIRVVRVVRGLGGGLDENAIRALEQWKFNPGTREGEPVDVALNIEVNFSLSD